MVNPNKKKGKEPKKRGYTPEERSHLMELMQITYPKMPKPLACEILNVEEKRLYGNTYEKTKTQAILDSMPIQMNLDYFQDLGGKTITDPWDCDKKGIEIKENFPVEIGNLSCKGTNEDEEVTIISKEILLEED